MDSIQPQPITPLTPKSKFLMPLLVVLGVVAVAAAAYFVFVRPVGEVAQSPSPSPSATSDETASWQTFSNNQYGYEVSYPTSWKIDTSAMNNVGFSSPEMVSANENLARQREPESYGPSMFIEVLTLTEELARGAYMPQPDYQHPDSFRTFLEANGWVSNIVPTTVSGGIPAYRGTLDGLWTYDGVIVAHGGYIYKIAFNKDVPLGLTQEIQSGALDSLFLFEPQLSWCNILITKDEVERIAQRAFKHFNRDSGLGGFNSCTFEITDGGPEESAETNESAFSISIGLDICQSGVPRCDLMPAFESGARGLEAGVVSLGIGIKSYAYGGGADILFSRALLRMSIRDPAKPMPDDKALERYGPMFTAIGEIIASRIPDEYK